MTSTKTKTKTTIPQDREIKLYEGFWHSLTAGELEKNVDQVFFDIFAWYAWSRFVMDVCHRCAYHDPQKRPLPIPYQTA